jgi:hypothetical protein
MLLDSSEAAARRALSIIWGQPLEGELVELSVRAGGGGGGGGRRRGGGWRTVACTVEEALDGGVAALRRASSDGADAYIGVAALSRRPEAGRRGGAALRGTAACLWLDIDCAAPGRDGPDYFAGVAEAVGAVDAVLAERAAAALVVGSGWGVQYFLPLDERVHSRTASAMVRALVAEVADGTGMRVDRVWDPSRVMRAPGTWNWRGGGGGEATGVLRWPSAPPLRAAEVPVAGGAGAGPVAGAAVAAGGGGGGGALMDLEAAADRRWTWAEILEPAGWRRSDGGGAGGGGGREAEVWARPGAPGDRSAVVYADAPGLLAVYSDSAETGLRGAGPGAVVTRWRALVALRWAGDAAAAADEAWRGWAASEAEAGAGVVAEWCRLAEEAWRGGTGAQEALRERARRAADGGAEKGSGR